MQCGATAKLRSDFRKHSAGLLDELNGLPNIVRNKKRGLQHGDKYFDERLEQTDLLEKEGFSGLTKCAVVLLSQKMAKGKTARGRLR